MSRVESSIEIAAPSDRVGAFFVPQRMPYWYGAEMNAEFEVQEGAADFCAGQKVRITGKVLRKEISLTVVITRYTDGRLLEWKFRDEYGVRGTQCWEILPAGAHRTRVTLCDEYALPSPGRLAKLADKFWMRPNIARRARLHLLKLKKLAERL